MNNLNKIIGSTLLKVFQIDLNSNCNASTISYLLRFLLLFFPSFFLLHFDLNTLNQYTSLTSLRALFCVNMGSASVTFVPPDLTWAMYVNDNN